MSAIPFLVIRTNMQGFEKKLGENYRSMFLKKIEELAILQQLAWPHLSKDDKMRVKTVAVELMESSKVFEEESITERDWLAKMAKIVDQANEEYAWLRKMIPCRFFTDEELKGLHH